MIANLIQQYRPGRCEGVSNSRLDAAAFQLGFDFRANASNPVQIITLFTIPGKPGCEG
jgi:hypothetical protein